MRQGVTSHAITCRYEVNDVVYIETRRLHELLQKEDTCKVKYSVINPRNSRIME